jgi:iron complex transport system substrate-binding protein
MFFMRRIAFLAAISIVAAGCASAADPTTTPVPADSTTTTTTPDEAPAFPVTVNVANGEVVVEEEPTSIVSLSPSATENLFAIGAGSQVVAVDDQSSYPEDAPVTDLSGFTPNLEAILSYEPDLVVITFDPGGILDGLDAVDVPVLLLPSATSIDAAYAEIEVLGAATGNIAGAAEVVAGMETGIQEVVDQWGSMVDGTTIYHEVDPTFYSVSSHSFVGELYERIGLINIADAADPDGFGYPQLSPEFIVDEDPDVILLADAAFGESLATLSQRPGWEIMSAVQTGSVVEIDADLASRWTPRSVAFLATVAEEISQLVPVN